MDDTGSTCPGRSFTVPCSLSWPQALGVGTYYALLFTLASRAFGVVTAASALVALAAAAPAYRATHVRAAGPQMGGAPATREDAPAGVR